MNTTCIRHEYFLYTFREHSIYILRTQRVQVTGLQFRSSKNVFLFLLRLFVEAIHDVQQGVAGQDVGIGLGAALGIDGTGDVVELTEEVKAVEHDEEFAFEEGPREAGIPYKVTRVQSVVGIACTGVEAEVCVEFQFPREF